MILMIDNYDSFTYNIAQYLGELGVELKIWRNDCFKLEDIETLNPEGIVISPGPCDPDNAGLTLQVLEKYHERYPFFGVCLGHQSIGQFFGGKVVHADYLMHGKVSEMTHNEDQMFADVENPFIATRYHSLVVEKANLPECLQVTAETADGVIMAFRHKTLPIYGVQFHPESYSTGPGKVILGNFLKAINYSNSVN